MTAQIIELRPRRRPVDNALAAAAIELAFAGASRARQELTRCGCLTLVTEDGARYLDHHGPELHRRNETP